MIQVRNGVFETNSSSIHSICISKKPWIEPRNYNIKFDLDYIGWEVGYADPTTYLHSAIAALYYDEDDRTGYNEVIDKIEKILASKGIGCGFDDPADYSWYGVDHSYELDNFIKELLSNEDKLLRFLLSPESCVNTGNDNMWYDETDSFAIAAYKDEDSDFEYFLKGN